MKNNRLIIGRMLILWLSIVLSQKSIAQQSEDLFEAIAIGDLEKVQAIIETDPSLLESRDKDGHTPLNKACRGANPDAGSITQVEVANYLLDKGANVNAKDNWGLTPLMQVNTSRSDQEFYDLMQRLILMGADVNSCMRGRNWTKISGAIFYLNFNVVKLLIDHGADINIIDIEGTPLQNLVNEYQSNVNDSINNLKLKMAKLLIESGAKLQEFSFGNKELHLAAIRGFADLMPILVKNGADVNAMNDYGHTPLFYAARHGQRSTAEALIAAGADKNTIVESNYGKAPQLTETLKEGEAWLWYLTCHTSPRIGYAVKTQNHLLIFNPSRIIESQETGLANGYLNPKELASQKITALNCYETPLTGSHPDIFELANAMPDADIILNVQPTDNDESNVDMPPYHQAKPNESFLVDGIQVHTIPACQSLFGRIKVLGYLVEADGLKIFHAGLHASRNRESQMKKYRKEIDFLKSFGSIDIAILPISGRHFNIDYEPYFYMIDQLQPKAIYLIGEELNTEEHKKCLEVLKTRDVPVFYPDGGIAVGQRFRYPAPEPPEFKDLKGDYLGQTPPGDIPMIFAPGIVATEDLEHSPAVFSPDGDEVYWITARPPGPSNRNWINREMTMRRIGNRWTAPVVSPYKGMLMFSPDGHRGYFWSDSDRDIFVIEKQDDCWSEPKCLNILKQFPELRLAIDPSVTKNGSLYFMGIAEGLGMRHDYAIYRTKLINGKYAKPELLPRSINLPPFQSWTPFVAPDESYLIFSSDRSGQFGGGDLYISFHDINADVWSEPVNMGEKVNTRAQERLPGVSPDGEYLFFTRWIPGRHDDIHWVNAKIINELKKQANMLK